MRHESLTKFLVPVKIYTKKINTLNNVKRCNWKLYTYFNFVTSLNSFMTKITYRILTPGRYTKVIVVVLWSRVDGNTTECNMKVHYQRNDILISNDLIVRVMKGFFTSYSTINF